LCEGNEAITDRIIFLHVHELFVPNRKWT